MEKQGSPYENAGVDVNGKDFPLCFFLASWGAGRGGQGVTRSRPLGERRSMQQLRIIHSQADLP